MIDVKDIPIGKKRVRPVKLQGDFESRRLWQHVTNALKVGDINTASEHKRVVSDLYILYTRLVLIAKLLIGCQFYSLIIEDTSYVHASI